MQLSRPAVAAKLLCFSLPNSPAMKKPTSTLIVILLFAAVALGAFIWTLFGGAADGSKAVMYWFGGIAAVIALLSRVLGGKWFTDEAGGH
jgi:hypothetical protein